MKSDTEDFTAYPQPEWNRADSVAVALERVVRAHDKETSVSAYDDLLYALGNNHAGTYYPVVLAVMPSIEKILRSGKPWPQHTALEALIDLIVSFAPEPGHETFRGVSVSRALRDHIIALKPCLDALVTDNDMATKSVQELQASLDETEQGASREG